MSLVPMFFRNWWDDPWQNGPFQTPRILDQHFGSGIFPNDLFRAMTSCQPPQLKRMGFGRPWGDLSQQLSYSSLATNKDKLQIHLDVQQFLPNEITVKTVENTIVVEGKHEEKQDEHGFVSRHFVRRYALPSEHDPKDVVSSLSSDGVLIITAPRKAPALPEATNARTVPITQTGEDSK
ncbi:protein lethal(2)essential for life-like [Toxorhynchites rutilus septentrionalis]|uniref:protein lethal(2)essential for life-like n=1 Tax=Toxorhynchites rutilus septentrionalis TaxID=329112 RepID=UPI00247A3627|nr:protein lethal(2)essential for life-like [Toxorhynchites rutilus septentrionalis]